MWSRVVTQLTGKTASPTLCLLCGTQDRIRSAGFHQIYPQKNLPPILSNWWECLACNGWFVHPVPSVEAIDRYWETVAWLDPDQEAELAQAKNALNERVL